VAVAVLGALTQREFRSLGETRTAELPDGMEGRVRNCR
jgi:hypothetical protein